MFYFFQI